MKPSIIRFLSFTAMLSMFACLALLAIRGYNSISFIEPLFSETRGAEYESLFPIWKVIQGFPLYTDLTRIPYAATYYNWLYYVSYAHIAEIFLEVLSLDDVWIPTITRTTTLVGAVAGAALMYLSMIRLFPDQPRWHKLVTASLSATVFLGPLTGFFAMATTPDIWPLVAAIAAMWIFIRYYEEYPLSTILAVCLLSYAAWSFKQNFANIPATVGLFLLIRRDWKNAALLTTILVVAGAFTLMVGGTEYRKMLLFGDTHLWLTLEQFNTNFLNVTVKTLPILALAGGFALLGLNAGFRLTFTDIFRQRSMLMLPFLGVLISMVEAIPTSAIIAAAENHYFHLIYFISFSGLVLLYLTRNTPQPVIWMALCTGFISHTMAISSVLMGINGEYSIRDRHDLLVLESRCLSGLSRSIFVDNFSLMLPWMVPATDHFTLEMSYYSDRAKGVEFEAGGVGGLIDQGYFEHIAILKTRGRRFDGSDLSLYPNLIRSCNRLNVYGRNSSPGS